MLFKNTDFLFRRWSHHIRRSHSYTEHLQYVISCYFNANYTTNPLSMQNVLDKSRIHSGQNLWPSLEHLVMVQHSFPAKRITITNWHFRRCCCHFQSYLFIFLICLLGYKFSLRQLCFKDSYAVIFHIGTILQCLPYPISTMDTVITQSYILTLPHFRSNVNNRYLQLCWLEK